MAKGDSLSASKIKEILNSGTNGVFHEWTAQFVVGEDTYNIMNVNRVITDSDYTKSFMDNKFVNITIPYGLYEQVVLPNKKNLKIRLNKVPVIPTGGAITSSSSDSYVYEAYLANTDVASLTSLNESSTLATATAHTLMNLDINLIEVNFLKFRGLETWGNHRESYITDVLKGELTQVIDGKTFNCTMVDADNKKLYSQLLIPASGIRLPQLPKFLQELDYGGIYSSGVGYYHLNATTYIYPLFDLDRYETESKVLTILNVPKNDLGLTEITYNTESGNTFILATGDLSAVDSSELMLNSKGNAIRYANKTSLHSGFTELTEDGLFIPVGRNRKELSIEDRPKGSNRVTVPEDILTSNPYKHLSELAIAKGMVLSLDWNNSDHALVYPGQPCLFMYVKDGTMYKLKGTVIGINTVTANRSINPTDRVYVTNSKLVLFCERIEEDQ